MGTRQHGLPDLKIADLVHDVKILEQSRRLAEKILEEGLEQNNTPARRLYLPGPAAGAAAPDQNVPHSQ